jgi:MFS family permease
MQHRSSPAVTLPVCRCGVRGRVDARILAAVLTGGRTIERVWPDDPVTRAIVDRPRDDLISEHTGDDGVYRQQIGPFEDYERRVTARDGRLHEVTDYRLRIPWFGWLFALPIRWTLERRGSLDRSKPPWWAPPDRLDPRQALVLGLLAAASMSAAFTNTLFTQTAHFAAEDFGVGDTGFGNAMSIVRAGIVITLPLAALADRVGRKRVMQAVAGGAPIISALGALAPTFPLLVATQAVGRPLGLALDFLIGVVVAEEMPRNSRAYAVSVMAMAAGLGSGIAVMALPLADLGDSGWRLVYVVTLIWLVVAVDITRRLPETARFQRPHVVAPRLDRRRFAVLAAVAVCANFFVAPASGFQNRYLEEIRGFDATTIALFTLITATPAGLGLVVGGKLADVRGRRRLIAGALPVATFLVFMHFVVGGPAMWIFAFSGGFIGGIAWPALAVYRAELFPTGNRGRAAGFLTAAALLGGIVGLQVVGRLLDRGSSYAQVIGLVALGQAVVVLLVLFKFPETAHRTLEDLNPEDTEPVSPPAF